MNHPTNSLWPTTRDERDFKLGSIVGHASPQDLPDEYTVAQPIVIKDQGEGTDMCTAYALTAVSEDEEGVALDPFYTFGATKCITGNKDDWGADLRSAAKSAVMGSGPYGFLEAKDLTKLTDPATPQMRDAAADWTQISPADREAAAQHAKKSFFAVDGPYDLFDNMRSAMWQTRDQKRSIFTGCNWRSSWTYSGGLITHALPEQVFGHALKAFGWCMYEGAEQVIKLQLSNGKEIGDNGIFYITREALNQAFTFGAFTFLDMPREDAERACVVAKVSTFFRITSPLNSLFSKIHL